ncbi:LysR family transcriptional regulator [Leucobacter muris]|uniref:LysR family transcriptional regulator n=1 Tax=Leucobacter muris TaxID=1935379 RepID=A0ABX5QCQ4_9MICO|nr:LysR family transcriptional regulator [Leucobacter muris]QAB16852.1 LysR family transcriptional regulator [Leucobacter muris]
MSNGDFTLKQLGYFLAVARYGSVTAAANAVDLSQSAMSNAIAELERSLGVQLLVRQVARGMFLTAAGELLVAKASRLLEDAEEVSAQVRSSSMLLKGPLRIGCYTSLVSTVLSAVLPGYMRRFPDVEVELREGSEDELLSWLRTGECDLLITYRVDLPADVTFTPIVTLRSYVLVSAEHPITRSSERALRELADTPFIMLDLPPSAEFFHGILNLVGISKSPRIRTRSTDVVRALVAENLGFTILTQPRLGLKDDHLTGRLRAFHLEEEVPTVDVGLARLASHVPTRRATEFQRVLEAVLPEQLTASEELFI